MIIVIVMVCSVCLGSVLFIARCVFVLLGEFHCVCCAHSIRLGSRCAALFVPVCVDSFRSVFNRLNWLRCAFLVLFSLFRGVFAYSPRVGASRVDISQLCARFVSASMLGRFVFDGFGLWLGAFWFFSVRFVAFVVPFRFGTQRSELVR